jgi:hypothetical protein
MSRPAKHSKFDREDLLELGRCFARAAVDELIEAQRKASTPSADRPSDDDAGNPEATPQ